MRSLAVPVLLVLTACGGSAAQPAVHHPVTGAAAPGGAMPTGAVPQAPRSLYDRLGGQPAVTAVIAEFVARTTTDDRVKDRFFNVDAENLKKLLVEFVCVAAGGGCKYEGRTMLDSHGGMDLVDDEFTAVVEDLVAALDKFHVPEHEKNEVLGALGPLKGQMVFPDKLHPIDEAKLVPVTKLAASLDDHEARRLLDMAVVAGKRGQRSYAEQLFARAELLVGPGKLAKVAPVFRANGPQHYAMPTKKIEDQGKQPMVVGGDDEAALPRPAKPTVLRGKLTIDHQAPHGLGVVMMYGAGGVKRTPKQRVVEQRDKAFAPHIIAVPVGSTISFPNYDTLFHNVFSLSKTKAFDLGLYKSGEAREVKFDKPGVVRIGCNIHANMSAYVIAVDAPHYVLAQPDGSFQFNSLVPGKYRAKVWAEGASDEPMTTEITVKAGDNETTLDLSPGANGNPDKFGTPR